MSNSAIARDDIELAINAAASRYFDDCRARIPAFTQKHFLYPGAISTNRVAWGWDILRAPLNLFWAPIYAVVCMLRFALKQSHHTRKLSRVLARVPAGLDTRVQHYISECVLHELLQHDKSPLQTYIINELSTLHVKRNRTAAIQEKPFHAVFDPLVREALIQYQVTRTASADISNTLSCAVIGAFTFKKFTPGGIGIGFVLASIVASELASRNFIFGDTLGRIYYSLFPPEPSLTLMSLSMLGVMAILSMIAALSGIISDPLQASIGLHQKRLRKMLDHLEADFLASEHSSFRPKDQFIARILDAFDVIKASLT